MSNPEKPKYQMSSSEHEEYFYKGIQRGHEDAQENPLEIGDLVYHPSDDCVYKLKSVENDIATVWIPADAANNSEDIIKQFPYAELINPKAAYRGAIEAKIEDTLPSVFKSPKDIQ